MAEKIPVLISGLGANGKGKMAAAVAKRIVASPEFELLPYALTAQETPAEFCDLRNNPYGVTLIRPSERLTACNAITQSRGNRIGLAVDFTAPDAILPNVEYFSSLGLDSVVGTSGGDLAKLLELSQKSGTNILYAPNMAPAVVSFQYFLNEYARANPGCLGFCELGIVESHQAPKGQKTSATAKEVARIFREHLGIQFDDKEINMIRDPEVQKKLGIPENYLGGHGWHTYTIRAKSDEGAEQIDNFRVFLRDEMLFNNPAIGDFSYAMQPAVHPHPEEFGVLEVPGYTSGSSDVFIGMKDSVSGELILVHNVNGREPYVDGTMAGLRNQTQRRAKRLEPRLSSMLDVIFDK